MFVIVLKVLCIDIFESVFWKGYSFVVVIFLLRLVEFFSGSVFKWVVWMWDGVIFMWVCFSLRSCFCMFGFDFYCFDFNCWKWLGMMVSLEFVLLWLFRVCGYGFGFCWWNCSLISKGFDVCVVERLLVSVVIISGCIWV